MILGRSNFGVKLVNLPVLSDGCRKYHELYYAKKHKPVLSTGQQDFMVGKCHMSGSEGISYLIWFDCYVAEWYDISFLI